MSMFNEFGNILNFPDDLFKAQEEYLRVVTKYLDEMTILEVRAFCYYLNLDAEIAAYIIRRQIDMRTKQKVNNAK